MLAGMVPKLLALVQDGVKHYGALRSAGVPVDADIVALYLSLQVADWNPVVHGSPVLDDDTKGAGCRFLGGLACRLGEITLRPTGDRA